MKIIKVKGARQLFGSITVSGSKNAALPIIFATLITKGVSVIRNLPDIGDVRVALEIIEAYGATVERCGSTVRIDTGNLTYADPSPLLISKIRASTYLIGASLARFGKASVGNFGGCSFCARPIDLHILAAEALGAARRGNTFYADRLVGARILLPLPSVGATANALIMAASADGESIIFNYAKEPHVIALADYLSRAGAVIRFTDGALYVRGGTLGGAECSVIGDMIEAGSYLAAGLATFGEVRVSGLDFTELSPFLSAVSPIASLDVSGSSVSLTPRSTSQRLRVSCSPYPGYPTDLQPLIAPVLACYGGGEINDNVFPTRFGYLTELSRFGVRYRQGSASCSVYPSILHAADATAIDLRGGMAALICALCAKGDSRIYLADNILRGYSDPIGKLRMLGAELELVDG